MAEEPEFFNPGHGEVPNACKKRNLILDSKPTTRASQRKWISLVSDSQQLQSGSLSNNGSSDSIQYDTLTVLTFNILSDQKALNESWYPFQQPPKFSERYLKIREDILCSDIAALQEVEEGAFKVLEEGLRESFVGKFFQPRFGPCGLALFIRRKDCRRVGLEFKKIDVNGTQQSKSDSNNNSTQLDLQQSFNIDTVDNVFCKGYDDYDHQSMVQEAWIRWGDNIDLHVLNMHLCGGKQDIDERKRAKDFGDIIDELIFNNGTDNVNIGALPPTIILMDSNGERTFAPKEKLKPWFYQTAVRPLLLDSGEFEDVLLSGDVKYTTKKRRGEQAVTERCVDYIFISRGFEDLMRASKHLQEKGIMKLNIGEVRLGNDCKTPENRSPIKAIKKQLDDPNSPIKIDSNNPVTWNISDLNSENPGDTKIYDLIRMPKSLSTPSEDHKGDGLRCLGVLDVPRDHNSNEYLENYMPNDDYVSDHLSMYAVVGMRVMEESK